MKATAIFCAILFSIRSVFGCINTVGTKYNGESKTGGRSATWTLRHYLDVDTHPEGVKMEAELRGSTNFNDRSDYSVALMYLGRSQEAVQLLETLENEKPGKIFCRR